MLLNVVLLLAGFSLLVWSANKFILGASCAAKYMGMPPLLVGLTFVAMGTSFPELMVSFVAALSDTPELAIGNAIGSNITNIGLVLGLTAIICPIAVRSNLLKREFPALILLMLLAGAMLWDATLSRFEGVCLLAGLVAYTAWLVHIGLTSERKEPLTKEYKEQIASQKLSKAQAWFWLLAGAFLLYLSARMVVAGGVGIASAFGVSDLIIGLTIVAIGTSLPELMASLISALKNEHDIAIGNVIGSNIFNLLGVMGLPALISPAYLEREIFTRDYAIMLLMTALLFIMAYGFKGPGRISRAEGAALLAIYLSYLGYLIYVTH